MAAPTPSTMTEPAFATFMQHVLTEILHELKSVRKELHDLRRGPPTPDPSRKRKRPGPTPPCTLCRLSRTPCIATHPNEACSRCISKQVECFDDEAGDPPRVRHPPEDGDDESEPEPEQHGQPQAPIVWQPTYPTGFPPTPVKRDRVPKACADCHARKRKCGPNCATLRVNGASSSRPSPTKPPTPNRGREPCAECRARKRRCIHNPDGTLTPGKTDENDDAPGEDVPVTDTEREPEHPATSSARHTPSRSHSPPPNGWHYRPPPPPPPPHPWGYEHRPGYPAHGHHGHHSHPHPQFHDRPPYHHPPPPMHPHPHPHPHARLPPAPDMRHPSCKDCHARGVPCTCSPSLTSEQKAATPTAPAGRKGRACLACRKLKMRCVAPNEEGGPDERCQRCERAGLECVYVDRKRRGPGGVGSMGPMDEAARKKLKREGAESEVSVEMTVGDDAARVLESFADDEDTSVRA